MSDGASGAFRAAMSGEPMPADAGANQPDVFADTGPVNFDDDGPSPSEQLRETVEGAQPNPAPKEDGDHVPSWRLREIREDRDRKDAELAAARKEADELREYRRQQEEAAKPKPDLFENTDQWADTLRNELRAEFKKEVDSIRAESASRWDASVMEELNDASSEKGKEFDEAAQRFTQALAGDKDLKDAWFKVRPSKAVKFIENWDKKHRDQQELTAAGGLEGLLAKREAEIRAKLEAEYGISSAAPQAPAAPRLVTEGPQPAARKPIPSLNRTAAAQGSDEPQGGAATLRSALRGG